jgi:Flp pilus assembly pilin Flp
MAKPIICVLFAVAMITAASPAHATVRYVGTCVKTPYTTISSAVAASAPNDRINVCPGTYPEQVVISIPLFLAGMEAFTATGVLDRAVITLPPTFTTTVTSQYNTHVFAPQILVQNVTPAGNFGVNIGNLTLDGSANPAGQPYNCQGIGLTPGLVGIFYDATGSAPNTVVRIADVTTRNQLTQNIGCGYGIWVENDGTTNQSVTIQNSSVHDFDLGGITAVTGPPGAPPGLTATISSNDVHSGSACPACLPYGIDAEDIDGTIESNIITGGGYGVTNGSSAISITHNTIAGSGTGIYLFEDGASTLSSNDITNVVTAFDVYGGSNPGPIIQSNTTKNTQTVVNYECSPNVTVTSNTFSDSATGFGTIPGTAPTATNFLFNIDTITSSCI